MRAVERTPWAERRSSRHDEICLAIVRGSDRIFPGFNGAVRCIVEAPLGRGFADVLALTDAPAEEQRAAILEVKTRDERCSAGDVIRQLRWYSGQLPTRLIVTARLILVVEDCDGMPPAALELVAAAGVEVLPAAWFTMAEAA